MTAEVPEQDAAAQRTPVPPPPPVAPPAPPVPPPPTSTQVPPPPQTRYVQVPPPPPPAAYGAPVQTNGKATAGLILGIASIFINPCLIPAILGIVFSSLGLKAASEAQRTTGQAIGQPLAIIGLVTAILGLLNSLAWKWMFLFLF